MIFQFEFKNNSPYLYNFIILAVRFFGLSFKIKLLNGQEIQAYITNFNPDCENNSGNIITYSPREQTFTRISIYDIEKITVGDVNS